MATAAPIQQITLASYGRALNLKPQYDNFIGGRWVAPASGEYFDNVTPVTGELLCRVHALRQQADVDRALDARARRQGGVGTGPPLPCVHAC